MCKINKEVQKVNILKERLKLGLSQTQAAKGIGISQGMLALLESGEREGSNETKKKVAKFYNKPVVYLFFNDDIAKRNK